MVLAASSLNRSLLWPRSGSETRCLRFNLFTTEDISVPRRACRGDGSDIFLSPADWGFPPMARSFSQE